MIDVAVKEIIKKMIEDPSAEVEMFRSVVPDDDPDGTEFEPGKGKTVVIKVDGGANNVEVNRVVIPGEQAQQ